MTPPFQIIPLTSDQFTNAVELVVKAELDTKEEIEHHLKHLDAHFVAISGGDVVGVIGWYQDSVHYSDKAMGNKFPGEEAHWVGFFAVDKNYQNKGIGTALLNKLEGVLKEKQVDTLWVCSIPGTKGYYEKKGFLLVCEGKVGNKPKFFLSKRLK